MMQKQNGFTLASMLVVLAILVFIAASVVAIAGEVYDRATLTTPTSGGAATWTNTVPDANLKLVRISVAALPVIDTVTVTRVTGNTVALTNTLVVIACTTSGGASNLVDQNLSQPLYMKAGDKLTVSSMVSTGATVYIEYLQQRH
jgi:Tfp pilus assembly major pilin PilA